jgi:hypothetical protein
MRMRPIAESRRSLIEEFARERAQLTSVAQECLERPGQATIAIGEVLAQDLIYLGCDPLVEGFGLTQHGVELATHDVDVHRGTGVLQGDKPDAECAANEGRPVVCGPLGHESREARVEESEVLDDEALAAHGDLLG